MKRYTSLGIFAVAAVLFGGISVTHACSVCLTGANDSSAAAFNWSLLFLMAMPYVVVGSIAGWLAYTYRRATKRRRAEAENPPVHLAWDQKESG